MDDNDDNPLIFNLLRRLTKLEKKVEGHEQELDNYVSLATKMAEAMKIVTADYAQLTTRFVALEKHVGSLDKQFSDMTRMLTPQTPQELTISEAIQQVVSAVATISTEMVAIRRRMREEPPAGTSDNEDDLPSLLLN